MYAPDPSDRFSSPFIAPSLSAAEPTVADQAKDFLTLHGKQILIALVALAVVYFVLDFFVLSVHPVTISVKNAEGSSLTSTIALFYPGSSSPFKTETGGSVSVSLKKGEYHIEVNSSGFDPYSDSLTVGDEEAYSILLEKPLKTIIQSLTVPDQIFKGVDTTGSVYCTTRARATKRSNWRLKGILRMLPRRRERVFWCRGVRRLP